MAVVAGRSTRSLAGREAAGLECPIGTSSEVDVARNFAEIQRELSELSSEERAKLALALVESLEPEDEGDIAEAWRVEAERRYEQFKRGEVQAIPGDEVFARIRSRLRSG